MLKVRRRFFTLLEVLIAFAIVVLCALPLIYPHSVMLREQHQFVRELELDHAVNLLYGNIAEKLYLNKINWPDLNNNTFEISEAMLKEAHYDKPLGFKGSFAFIEEKHKPKKIGNYNIFKFNLVFTFIPNEYLKSDDKIKEKNKRVFKYIVFIVRDLRAPGGNK